MKKILSVFCIAAVMLLSSCSMRKAATTMTGRILGDGMKALESESDLWIAGESVVPLIKILEVLKEGDPENKEFLGLMAKAYGNIAFGFFEPRYLEASKKEKNLWRGRIERYYRLGYESGMKSLEKRLGRGVAGSFKDFEAAVRKAGKKDAQVLFWTAFDLGNMINLRRDDVASIANLPKVGVMVERVLEIDSRFGSGSALAFKAAMLASRPKMLGGDPEKARALFDEAEKVCDGKYLMTRVMFAEWFAFPQGDKELGSGLLREVLAADPMALPEEALANHLAQERARILMKM